MLEVANLSPFAYLCFAAIDAEDQMAEVVVAKGTYRLDPETSASAGASLRPTLEPERTALAVQDEFYGAVNRTSVRTESDLAPFKPHCDLVVIGDAHSPAGQPASSVTVEVAVERAGRRIHAHRLTVHGERELVRRDPLARGAAAAVRLATAGAVQAPEWYLSETEPFTSCPLRYELAFGGEMRIEADDPRAGRLDEAARLSPEARKGHPDGDRAPAAHRASRANPIGRGFLEPWYVSLAEVDRVPAPRIEAADAPFTAELFDAALRAKDGAGDSPGLAPHGFGIVTKAWQPRLKLAGTYDDEWRHSRWPNLPRDFDMAYWNGAHPAMQCEHLQGRERVTLTNLLPPDAPGTRRAGPAAVVASFLVPSVDLALYVELENGHSFAALMPIDTLTVDLAAMDVHLVWRMRVPADLPVASASLVSLAELRDGPDSSASVRAT